MATRMYLRSTGSTPINPTLAFGDTPWWDNTTNAVRYTMGTTKKGTTNTTVLHSNMNASSDQFFLRAQFVSEFPLASAYTFQSAVDTVTICIVAREELSTDNATINISFGVCAADGTTFRGDGNKRSSFDDNTELSTSLASRIDANTLEETFAAQAGDYLVVEVGYDIGDTPSDADFAMNIGDDNASDLVGDNDADDSLNPWIEFSANLSFNTGATHKLMMMGVGQ